MIAKFFKTPLRVPRAMSTDDRRNIGLLRCVVTGETFSETTLTMKLTKISEHATNFLDFISDRSASRSIRIEDFSDLKVLPVFGQNIHCGKILFLAENVIVVDPEEARNRYADAKDSDLVSVQVHCKGPCRFVHADHKDPLFSVSEDSVKRVS